MKMMKRQAKAKRSPIPIRPKPQFEKVPITILNPVVKVEPGIQYEPQYSILGLGSINGSSFAQLPSSSTELIPTVPVASPFSFNLPTGSLIIANADSKVVIRCPITCESEWNSWFQEFKSKSNTAWISRSSNARCKRYKFSRDYVCNRSGYKKKNPRKNCNCKAAITVRIKKQINEYRDKYGKNGLWGIVKINYHHTHATNSVVALSFLRPTSSTRDKFEDYFSNGMSVPKACKTHTDYLKLSNTQDNIESILANATVNPKLRTVRYWYDVWRQKNLESWSTNRMEDVSSVSTSRPTSPSPPTLPSSIHQPSINIDRPSTNMDLPPANIDRPPTNIDRPPTNINLPPTNVNLTAFVTKLTELNQRFGTNLDVLVKLMKKVDSIKDKTEWDSFLFTALGPTKRKRTLVTRKPGASRDSKRSGCGNPAEDENTDRTPN